MPTLMGLRAAREDALLSQTELAERAGVRQATISKLERQLTSANYATVRKLAVALGVDGHMLVSGPLPSEVA